eukprot:CAMPEP_0195569952 /NCGR_PEP_ID=MMETSP0814-20130614/3126_1 /TAXON_ID=97485 /ORGANISM="Prymnesium parvum, Strain Texoma1" /LENGTH=148 /DNA_ID=CAMNT_0040705379 /DNA_START=164 /DNA_END=611 /DNA_ORIENTATION=-
MAASLAYREGAQHQGKPGKKAHGRLVMLRGRLVERRLSVAVLRASIRLGEKQQHAHTHFARERRAMERRRPAGCARVDAGARAQQQLDARRVAAPRGVVQRCVARRIRRPHAAARAREHPLQPRSVAGPGGVRGGAREVELGYRLLEP